MKRHFYIAVLFLSLLGKAQVTLVNNTNLNGFNVSACTFLKQYNGIDVGCWMVGSGTIDTTMNLAGYDSLHMIFTAYTSGFYGGGAWVNGKVISTMPSSYTMTSVSPSNPTMTYSMTGAQGPKPRYLYIQNMKIIGYGLPSVVMGVQQKENLQEQFSFYGNCLKYTGAIAQQQLLVYDMLGNLVCRKDLEPVNHLVLSQGVYITRVVESDRILYTRKIALTD